jgi:hypothetical protein
VLRLRKIRRNEAKLASLGLLEGMMSAASPSAHRTNRKKRVATQGDFVRRIQPKRNVFKPTSCKDLDDPVISKRTLHGNIIEKKIGCCQKTLRGPLSKEASQTEQ